MKHQDLTIFSIDDDDVPLSGYGTVDEYGEITEATFSTDPEHPRPYLKRVHDLGESAVDFLAGGSVIGQLTVDVVDVPRTESDQDTGIMTYLAAAVSGDTALLGVRMVFREDGEVIFDGICGPITMPKLTTFRLQLRDPRERERGIRLFNRPTYTCLFPVMGPVEGWGFIREYDATTGVTTVGDPVFPPIHGVLARYRAQVSWGSGFLELVPALELLPKVKVGSSEDAEYYDVLAKYAKGALLNYTTILGGVTSSPEYAFPTYAFNDILVEFSEDDGETWTRIGPMVSGGIGSVGMAFKFAQVREGGVDNMYLTHIMLIVGVGEVIAGKTPPDDDAVVLVRVLSNREPNEDVPLFLEERFGSILKKAYDGDYSFPGTVTPVRYDEARMNTMIANTPHALARITKPVDDGREWLQENVYRASSHAPAIRNGRVYPIKYELPDENEPLTQLDDSNTVSATWEHGPGNVVNQVIVKYEREIVPTSLPRFWRPRTQKVIIERNNLSDDSQRRHGTKPQVIEPETLRSVVSETDVFTRVPAEETGGMVSLRIGEELLRRFTNGAQIVHALCHRTEDVDALNEGDWVIGAWSWLPNYATRERGMNRLLQVIQIRRSQPHLREFLLLDAGPHDQPIEQPTVGTLEENDDGSVTIPITDIPVGGRAEVQYALGETQPDANSGLWRTVAYLDEDADTRTPPYLWPARLVWVRARGTQRGRRASAWTTPVSLRLADQAILRNFTLDTVKDPDSADYGKPIVRWDQLTGTGGVRVKYAVHAPFTDPPTYEDLDTYQDFDADDGEGVLDISIPIESDVIQTTLRQWEQVTVQVIAYPGFSAGVVTGTPGAFSALRTVARVEDHYVKPSVGEIVDRVGFVGRLRLEIIDQQLTITSVWFRTREGNDESAWSDFAEDLADPYTKTVPILSGSSSAIGYEVYARDHAGVERLFKSGTVEYPFEGPAGLRAQATKVSGADNDTYEYWEIRVIDPAPQGTDTITLTAVEDGANVTDPPDILTTGEPTGVVTTEFTTTGMVLVTVERPPYVGGSPAPAGTIEITATAANRTSAVLELPIAPEEAPEESVLFNDDLSVERDDDFNDLLNFSWTIASGLPDYIKILTFRSGGPFEDMGITDTNTTHQINSNAAWSWNLVRPPDVLGDQTKSIRFRLEAYDADDNLVGSAESDFFFFEAYLDS